MIPNHIHQTWKTDEVPVKWQPFVDKVRALNPGWEYTLWSDEANDAFVRREFPDFYDVFAGFPKPIMRADVIRYLIMYRIGGVYLDLDYEMLAPFDFGEHEIVLPLNRSKAFGDPEDALGNCIFASAPGHWFWRNVIDDLKNNPPAVGDYGEVIDATGPGLLTRIWRQGEYDDIYLPERILYHPPTPSGPKAAARIRNNGKSLGIHHPWGSWRERWTVPYIKKKIQKNMRKLTGGKGILTLLLIAMVMVSCVKQPSGVNADREDWVQLFNGKDLSGWTPKVVGEEAGSDRLGIFSVEDSMIAVRYNGVDTFTNQFGHLYSEQSYSHYKIRLEYRFVGNQCTGGPGWARRNSGIMLHAQSPRSKAIDQHFPVAIEFQFLGGLSDGSERPTGNLCTPGTTVILADTTATQHCINSSSATFNGDQWVHVEAVVRGGKSMDFLVNGDTVLSFAEPRIGDGLLSARDEGRDWDNHGASDVKDQWTRRAGELLTSGHLALQAESHPLDIRNIELLELCGCMDPAASNYKSYYVCDRPETCEYASPE